MNLEQLNELNKKIDETDEDTDEFEFGGINNIAIKNIKHRIVSYYGNACGISINNGDTAGLEVKITLGIQSNIPLTCQEPINSLNE